jgi:hypothetical protein
VAGVSSKNKWGLIDKMGNEIIDLEFDFVETYDSGIVVATQGSKKQYFDTHGNILKKSQ